MYKLWYYRSLFTRISSEIEGGKDMTDVLDQTRDVPPALSEPTFDEREGAATDGELLVKAVQNYADVMFRAGERLPEHRAEHERIVDLTADAKATLNRLLSQHPGSPG